MIFVLIYYYAYFILLRLIMKDWMKLRNWNWNQIIKRVMFNLIYQTNYNHTVID